MAHLFSHGTQQAEIGGGEGIWLPQLAHGDILSRPFPNASDRAKPVHRVVRHLAPPFALAGCRENPDDESLR